MTILNDDGIVLDLKTVLLLFLSPNILLIVLTALCTYFVHASKNCPRLLRFLDTVANFFSRGALVGIIASILQQLEAEKHRDVEQSTPKIVPTRLLMTRSNSLSNNNISPRSSSPKLTFEKKQDADYLLLIPMQIDLLFTVFFYKILTREVYFETCRTYLTTYYNRPRHIVCWHKYTNKNISNSDVNSTLHDYCINQTISYINYEYNDVICIQYAFKLINIIDTTTNVLAWHQAIVFIVTKSIVCAYWWQRKMRKTSFWSRLGRSQRRIILAILIYPLMTFYIVFFVFIVPAYFFLMEKRRIDLTHYLMYACFKFVIATIAHINLYTLSKWYSHYRRKDLVLTDDVERAAAPYQHRFSTSHDITKRLSFSNSMASNDPPARVRDGDLDDT